MNNIKKYKSGDIIIINNKSYAVYVYDRLKNDDVCALCILNDYNCLNNISNKFVGDCRETIGPHYVEKISLKKILNKL